MNYINKIQIKYFRSLYNVSFPKISSALTVFTGKNDVGKSNVLRALNLFFNNEVDCGNQVEFYNDFSLLRREEIRKRVKTKQLISITIEFNTPPEYKSLPKHFTVTKNFDRYNTESDFIFQNKISKNKKMQASARRFINSLEYIYIPAIKDNNTFRQVLQSLKSNLPPLSKEDVEHFNKKLDTYGTELKRDFKNKLNLTPILGLPSTAQELFHSLDFFIQDDIFKTPLSQRGDGVRCRFIPTIMYYIASRKKGISEKRYIWGIEEPENSLEYSKAIELSATLEKEYSKKAQILITSHSPAFIELTAENTEKKVYLLSKEANNTIQATLMTTNLFLEANNLVLSESLGYIFLQNKLASCLRNHIQDVQNIKEKYLKLVEDITSTQQKYILCVEGDTDKTLLTNAWNILCPEQVIPFYIHVCYCSSQIRTLMSQSSLAKRFPNKTFIGLFDFDSAFSDWNGLSNKWNTIINEEPKGLLRKSTKSSLYAMLLPVPSFRKQYASMEFKDKSMLSIELLFPDSVIKQYTNETICPGGGKVLYFIDKNKTSFANASKDFTPEDFSEFQQIFKTLLAIQKGTY